MSAGTRGSHTNWKVRRGLGGPPGSFRDDKNIVSEEPNQGLSHSPSQSFDFVESLFLEGLFKARSFQKFSESKVFTKEGGQVLGNFSFVSSRLCLCFFPEIGPASVMVGNLVSGKRIAQASGRDLGQIEDNDQARKVGTGSPTLPDPPRPCSTLLDPP